MNMDAIQERQDDTLSRVVQSNLARINADILDGRKVWIKRFEAETRPFFKWLHSALSPLMAARFLRSSPLVDPVGMMERELRKRQAFQAAGFAVLDIIYAKGTVIVSEDAPRIALSALEDAVNQQDRKKTVRIMHDLADSLARVHAAGLCHGRPHPRDLFLRDGEVGYFDFEEEPEAVMPMAAAQARDIWLLFLLLSPYVSDNDMFKDALDAYLAQAPQQAIAEFKKLVRFFARFLPLFALVQKIKLGRDGQRFMKATQFLQRRLL